MNLKYFVFIIDKFKSSASNETLLLVAIGNDINLIKESELESWLSDKEKGLAS